MYVRGAHGTIEMMTRGVKRLLASFIAATSAVSGSLRLDAQTPSQSNPVRRLVLPASGTVGLSGSYWRSVIGNGGPMPGFERLLVIGRDGAVLGEVNGGENDVLVPEGLCALLSTGSVRATLVHNHPGGVSLSARDLSQLAKAGVDRVIAVSPDGSVFEAARGPRFDLSTFDTLYDRVLAEAADRVNREAQRDGVDLARLYPNLTHLGALALDRAGVIHYRLTPSLKLRTELDRYRRALEWTVDSRR